MEIDWEKVSAELDERGSAVVERLLSPAQCRALAALYEMDARFPPEHKTYLKRCHAAGQRRPTPLLLKYGAGDYNCLHQDLYGEHVFPLQLTILLSEPHRDFTGGEFVMTEQRPRMQSRAEVVPLAQGDAVIFAVNERPVRGTRGAYRVKLRHGGPLPRLRDSIRRSKTEGGVHGGESNQLEEGASASQEAREEATQAREEPRQDRAPAREAPATAGKGCREAEACRQAEARQAEA